MQRWVYRHRTVTGNPTVLDRRLREGLPALLAAATDQDPMPPHGDGSFSVRVETALAGAQLLKTVRVRIGVATTRGSRTVIPLRWDADPLAHSFPAFDGTVELEPLADHQAQLTLVGCYQVPAGPLGAALDATLLRGVAERTVAQLLDGLARALTDIDLATVAVKGRQLRVRDVMTSNPLILDEDLPLRTAALLLFHYDVAGAPVQDAHGNLLGVLSEADLLEKEASPHTGLDAFLIREATRRDRLRSARTVGEACTRPAWVTDASSTLQDAARELLDHRIARLVVLDHSRIAGVVSRHDVLAALIRADEHIQADVDRVLVIMAEPAVHAVVEWGRVTVTGTVERCSRLSELRVRLEQVDGVMDLDLEQVTWRSDDVSIMTPMF